MESQGAFRDVDMLDQNFDKLMETDPVSLPFPTGQAGVVIGRIRLDDVIAKEDEWRWTVAKTFFDHRGLVSDQITSYNSFVETGIHEMFREAEPFEVASPEEERASQKRVLVTFGDVELQCKPEVEIKDRVRVTSEDTTGCKSSADKGKGSRTSEVDVGWLTNDQGGSSSGAKHDATRESSASPADGSHGKKRNGGVNLGDDLGNIEDQVASKGKGKSGSKYNLNVVDDADDNASDGEGNNENGVGREAEEPPKISRETWGMDDPPDSEGMEKDPEDDFPTKSGYFNEMELEHVPPTKAGKASGWEESDSSPATSPAKRRKPAGETSRSGGGEDAGKADLGYSMGGHTDGSRGGKPRPMSPNLKLLPVEARMRGITYSSPIYVNVTMETTIPETPKRKSKSSTPSASSSRKRVDKQKCRVLLGRIPVMVKSVLCHLDDSESHGNTPFSGDCCMDPGAYFIIKGSEKVIVAQEERNLQRLWVSCLQGVWTAFCTTRRRGFLQYNYHRILVKLAVPKKTGPNQRGIGPLISVVLNGVEPIPVGVLFCALGVSSDREILEMICYNFDDAEVLQTVCPSLVDSAHALAEAFKGWDANTFATVKTKRDKDVALFYIGSKTFGKKTSDENVARDVLKLRLLPHLGSSERRKAFYLAYMVRTVVLCYLGRRKGTDKDDIKNKRLEFAGEIISHQFRKLMGQVINTMKKRIQKHLSKGLEVQSADKYLDDKVITKGLKVAFSSGNWRGHDIVKNSGIVFDLKRGNPLSTLCQLRELRHFVPPTVRVGDEARHPTFSQWGRVCPIDTPDGESCGLVKNMALTGLVSGATPEGPVLKILSESTMEGLGSVKDLSSLQEATKIFLNGKWIGIIDAPDAANVVSELREARRRSLAKTAQADLTQVEVVTDDIYQEVHVSTDGGRILRPLLIVKDQALVLNEEHVGRFSQMADKKNRFQWLLRQGVVELLGIEEEEKAMIALHGEDIRRAKDTEERGGRATTFTHAELHPSLMLGLSASVIPFPNRNQSSRNLYQAHKHSKQAIGVYVTNITSRADTSGQHLFYPQMQLVKTNTFECLQKPEMFSGQNAIVAIACYTGYNQEDSIIMDQSSLDRGMFRTTHYRTIRTEERTEHESFGKPLELESGGEKLARSIKKLDEDGLPGVGSALGVGDVIIGKICKTQTNSDSNAILTGDRSQRLKAHEKGNVAQVVLVEDDDGNKVAKVKLRETRMPQVGDKFSSMHGQKGIVGMVFPQEDLPFTCEGIVPDVIINPHAFPSRQTLGQMCESALGKVVATTGERLFATPFNPSTTVESISDALHKAGYERWGTEIMYNGFTGEPMEAAIFIGSTFYQRLTHMVEDKIKYRSRGHVHPLTRQPVSDRKRHGGVKFGEMERDCLIAHGAAATLQERSFILSDFHTVHVCTLCEQLANWNADRVPTCRHCPKGQKKGSAIVKVELPYACKLLMQELMSMGISVRLKTEQL